MKVRPREIVFALIPLLCLLIALELGVRAYFYQAHARYPAGLVQLYSELLALKKPPTAGARHEGLPYFQADPVVGFKYIPGEHHEAYVQGDRRLEYKVVIGPDGYRTTSPNPEAYAGKPELWIFGCSFTWGLGLNNEDTFPWLLQKDLPNYRVRNLAVQGVGNLPALLTLTDAAENHKPLPAVALIVYDSFHIERNDGSPPYLLTMSQEATHDDKGIRFPRAVINAEGNFEIQRVELKENLWKNQPAPESSYQELVTRVIFYRIFQVCSRHGIIPVFGLQSKYRFDQMPQYAASLGFHMIDFSIDLNAKGGFKYRNYPFDGHVNKLGNAEWSQRLLPALRQILP